MIKSIRLRAALIVPIAALAAACSDAVGPAPQVPTDVALSSGPGRVPHFGRPDREDESVTEFIIRPRRTDSFTIGSHVLIVPADAVCDPELSTYGPGTWNDDCTAIRKPIKVTAYTWREKNGLPRVQFSPELRFHPSKTVQLWMKDRAVKEGGWYSILYCVDELSPCVDESISDPTLHSFVLQKQGVVYRRIKHFSVYNLVAESWGSPDSFSY